MRGARQQDFIRQMLRFQRWRAQAGLNFSARKQLAHLIAGKYTPHGPLPLRKTKQLLAC